MEMRKQIGTAEAGRTDRKVGRRDTKGRIPRMESEHLTLVCPFLACSSGKCLKQQTRFYRSKCHSTESWSYPGELLEQRFVMTSDADYPEVGQVRS